MAEFPNKRIRNLEKRFPGCMGRMVSLFDSSPGMVSNKLLTEKAHRDGSPSRSDRPDVAMKAPDCSYDQIEEKPVATCELSSSNKKSNGTSMKMVMAKEMSKETESRPKRPGVIAKLMGLDGLPTQHPVSMAQRSLREVHLQNASARLGPSPKHHQQENGFIDKKMPGGSCPNTVYNQDQLKYKDVHEVRKQLPKINCVKDQLQLNGRHKESSDEKMALVRQKFIEAKHLATDEKLHQSKEFQDALEIPSSNRELFIKFLQEPNSLFTKHLYGLHSIPPPPQTKRITILKPSMPVETNLYAVPDVKIEKEVKRVVGTHKWDKKQPDWSSVFVHHNSNSSPQPTRIVVLKPSRRIHDVKALVSSPTTSPKPLQSRDFYGEPVTDEVRGSKETATEIQQQVRESMSSSIGGKAFLSSTSNGGYIGDESSLNRSQDEQGEEGNLSDSEIMTPTSRHSWDYVNRYNYPYSSSPSLSRESHSPESSVTREAKKRLSERLAMMASNASSQEQGQMQRSSSTLAEMLALPHMKKPMISGNEHPSRMPSNSSSKPCGRERASRGPISCFSAGGNGDKERVKPPRNLSRSRSVPMSSTVYEEVGLSVEPSDHRDQRPILLNEPAKPSSGKFFRSKISSLFFSRNKKPNTEDSSLHPSVVCKNGSPSAISETPGVLPETRQLSIDNSNGSGSLEEELPPNVGGSCETSIQTGLEKSTLPPEEALPLEKTGPPENSSENQSQPSPTSVLEAPFEDDCNKLQSESTRTDGRESPVHLHFKSEPTVNSLIETVTNSVSCDDACFESPTTKLFQPLAFSFIAEKEEKEWFVFVWELLLSAGLLDSGKSEIIFTRWHSLESPMDPALLDKFISQKEDEELPNEAKCRQWKSERRLIFDCVNAALASMARSRLNTNPWASSCCERALRGGQMMEAVWSQVKELISGEVTWVSGENDTDRLVERVVRGEVLGREWVELMRLEADRIGEEIEGMILEELVNESLA